MNPHATSMARTTFLQAAQPGPSREPAAVMATLTKLGVQDDATLLDVSELDGALDAEFPWRNLFVFQSRQPMPDEVDIWVQTIRWLLQALVTVDIAAAGGARRLQVLLSALGALDVGCEGLATVSDQFVGTHVPDSIISLLRGFDQVPVGLDPRSREWLQELPSQVKASNFKILRQAQRFLHPHYRSDIWTSVLLLWKLQPAELARFINSRDNIPLAILICMVLDANAPLFAQQVENVTFKFVSLSWLERMQGAYPEVNRFGVLEQLLLQVSKTPHWRGWLHALYEHPETGSGESRALADALTKLGEPQWKDFISALGLSTSRGAAESTADILAHVSNKLGSLNTQSIWSNAFERWDAWDYGKEDGHFYLGSPQVCAFDFPVSMYYALMPSAERHTLEQELYSAIVHIEQQWFSSESELCSERNRLASRLRLIRHGNALATGGRDALPPPVQPDSEYAEVRYRYHDVNEVLTRTTGR